MIDEKEDFYDQMRMKMARDQLLDDIDWTKAFVVGVSKDGTQLHLYCYDSPDLRLKIAGTCSVDLESNNTLTAILGIIVDSLENVYMEPEPVCAN